MSERESQEDVAPAVQRLFKTADGDRVLKYLRHRFYDNQMKDEHLERQVGRRDVVQLLVRLTEG